MLRWLNAQYFEIYYALIIYLQQIKNEKTY